jgi:hypothetical protein
MVRILPATVLGRGVGQARETSSRQLGFARFTRAFAARCFACAKYTLGGGIFLCVSKLFLDSQFYTIRRSARQARLGIIKAVFGHEHVLQPLLEMFYSAPKDVQGQVQLGTDSSATRQVVHDDLGEKVRTWILR